VLSAFVSFQTFGQTQVNRLFFKAESRDNNSVELTGVDMNIYFRSAGDRFTEFKKKLKYIDFDGQVNFWCADSTLDRFSYVYQGINLGTHPVTIMTDFEWNIDRINNLLKEKKINIQLKQMSSDILEKKVYEMVPVGSNCKSSEEFDFYINAVELTVKDLSEVYNDIERLGNFKYIGLAEFRSYKAHTDSLIEQLQIDFSDSLRALKNNQPDERIFNWNIGVMYACSIKELEQSDWQKTMGILLSAKYNINYFGIRGNFGFENANISWHTVQSGTMSTVENFTNLNFNQLIVENNDVSETYRLSSKSVFLGADFLIQSDKNEWYGSVNLRSHLPFLESFNFQNTGGKFNYIGVSDAIQEHVTNIPDIGLLSNVSYIGYTSKLEGKLKVFYDFGVMIGHSFGEKLPIDLFLSINLTTNKKFKLKENYSAISSSFGNYNSLLSVNNSVVTIPGYLNFGLGLRKYLN
jgi:hypothetical protein